MAPCAAYVYYRVPATRQDEVLARVHMLFQQLRATWPGLQASLMHKMDVLAAHASADAQPADATWMEVYEHPLGVSADCLAHIEGQARTLLADQTGPRHVELFAPVHLPGGGLA
jgi:hypothetical protein